MVSGTAPLGGRADGRLELPQAAVELAANLQKAGVIQPEQLGMQNGESRGQNESQAQDQHHRGQSAIRHGLHFGMVQAVRRE